MFSVATEGDYTLSFRGGGQQAGPDAVYVNFLLDNQNVYGTQVPEAWPMPTSTNTWFTSYLVPILSVLSLRMITTAKLNLKQARVTIKVIVIFMSTGFVSTVRTTLLSQNGLHNTMHSSLVNPPGLGSNESTQTALILCQYNL